MLKLWIPYKTCAKLYFFDVQNAEKSSKSLKKYHTYGIDAYARFLVEVSSVEEIKNAIQFTKEEKISYVILGRGSNVLFKDDFFDGLIIINKMKEVKKDFKEAAGRSLKTKQLSSEDSIEVINASPNPDNLVEELDDIEEAKQLLKDF